MRAIQCVVRARPARHHFLLYNNYGRSIHQEVTAHTALEHCVHVKSSRPQQGKLGNRAWRAWERRRDDAWQLLLSSFAQHGLVAEACAVLDDMELCHVPIDATSLNLALKAAVLANNIPRMHAILARFGALPGSSSAAEISSLFAKSSVSRWTVSTYTHLLHYCARTSNMEFMLLTLFTAHAYQVKLEEDAWLHVIDCAFEAREPQIAWEAVQRADAIHPVSPTVWMHVLRACAVHDYPVGLPLAWERSVVQGGLVPDDGLLMHALISASRAGLSTLATQILEKVPSPSDTFLVPALDAHCEAGNFDAAVVVLAYMHSHSMPLQPTLLAHLTSTAAADDLSLQQAAEALLASTAPLSLAVWNAVLYAAAERSAITLTERIVNAMRVTNAETYQVWLLACLHAKDLAAGQRAWASLRASKVQPTATCYERMARLYLQQPQYDEAFALLEQAKSHGCIPTRRMYVAMTWTCYRRQDPRWQDLLREMQEAKYEPGDRLRALLHPSTT